MFLAPNYGIIEPRVRRTFPSLVSLATEKKRAG